MSRTAAWPAPRTRKPGEFRASCRKGAYLPVHQLTEAERVWAEDEDARRRAEGLYGGVFKYDRRLKLETALVRCELDTTDPAELEAHLNRVHGGGLYRWDAGGLRPTDRTVKNYAPKMAIPVKPWKAPKLTEEGKPWPENDDRTQSCPCGLVAEVGDLHADRLWWDEHINFCTERGAA